MHLRPPYVLGNYRVHELVAQGGTSAVYRGKHLDSARQVIIKIAPLKDTSPSLSEREWRAVTAVVSPHVVRPIERHELPDGSKALVMECIDGVVAADLIGKISPDEALKIAIAVAAGLCALHNVGIVHRDIKPTNVIVPFDADGRCAFDRAVVLDLGLAKFRDDDADDIGQIVGTPNFMAPEQLSSSNVTPASDVWSLAVLTFELLYGSLPFASNRFVELVREIRTASITIPDEPQVPAAIRTVLLKAFSRNAAARYQTGCEFRLALQAAASPSAVAHRQVTADKAGHHGRRGLRPSVVGLSWLAVTLACASAATYSASPWMLSVAIATSFAGTIMLLIHLKRRKRVEAAAAQGIGYLMLAVGGRRQLTASLALHVEELVANCRGIDEQILGTSLALHVNDLIVADTSADRRATLAAISGLVEKLAHRFAPWYVRYEKAITAFVALGGVLPAFVAVLKAIGWL